MCLFRSMISLHGLPYALRGMYIHLEAKRRTGAATLMATGSIFGGSLRGYSLQWTIQYRAAIGDFQNAATLGRGCASEYAESTPVPRLAGSGAEVSAKYHWGSRR